MFTLACCRHQTAIHAKVIQEIPIRNAILDDIVKARGKGQIFKSAKLISHLQMVSTIVLFCFFPLILASIWFYLPHI